MGKTTLALKMAQKYKANNIPLIVLDPIKLNRWNADYITDNPNDFVNVVFKNTRCALFIDESGEAVGRYGGAMKIIATKSRQWGHNAHFITQRAQDLDKTMRYQCTNIFVFRLPVDDGKILDSTYAVTGFRECANLFCGEYLYKLSRTFEVKKSRIPEITQKNN